jgi:hypothetical protein
LLKKLLLEMPETDIVDLLRPHYCWQALVVAGRERARHRPDEEHPEECLKP